MKSKLITIFIALVTGISGYYVGKHDLITKLSLPDVESNTTSETEPKTNPNTGFTAEAIIQINPFGKKSNALGLPKEETEMMTTQFFQTQFAIISSVETINRAIDDYRLDELFETDKSELLQIIEANLKTKQLQGTDLISIKVTSDDETKAQQLCYTIVRSYERRRREITEQTRRQIITQYKEKIEEQQAIVDEAIDRLSQVSKNLDIPYYGISGKPPVQPVDPKELKPISPADQKHFNHFKDEYERKYHVLQSIKTAEFQEALVADLEYNPIAYHKRAATPEIEAQMGAREQR